MNDVGHHGQMIGRVAAVPGVGKDGVPPNAKRMVDKDVVDFLVDQAGELRVEGARRPVMTLLGMMVRVS